MSDISVLKNLPKKFTQGRVYGKTNYIKFGELEENLKTLVNSLKIELLSFKYEREDKKNLLGHYTNFNFWLESDKKVLVILDCKINRNTLYHFLTVLNKFCSENLIELENCFDNDGYRLDTTKKEIVRKICREKTNYNKA